MMRGKGVPREEDVVPTFREGFDVILLIPPEEDAATHVYVVAEESASAIAEKSGWEKMASLGSIVHFVAEPNSLAVIQKFKDVFPYTRLEFDFTAFFA
ncbi:MAG: hypothetical protein AAB533_02900 [Patescibacteria group bacterium]